MPALDIRFESRLNGAKTNLVNVEEIGTALRTPYEAIMKFMSD